MMNTITRDFGYTCNGIDSQISETKSEFGLGGGGSDILGPPPPPPQAVEYYRALWGSGQFHKDMSDILPPHPFPPWRWIMTGPGDFVILIRYVISFSTDDQSDDIYEAV